MSWVLICWWLINEICQVSGQSGLYGYSSLKYDYVFFFMKSLGYDVPRAISGPLWGFPGYSKSSIQRICILYINKYHLNNRALIVPIFPIFFTRFLYFPIFPIILRKLYISYIFEKKHYIFRIFLWKCCCNVIPSL